MSADRRLLGLALGSTLALAALRVHVALGTGFGDAEALYACYALHPQPGYLDHPGLIGSIARLLGGGDPPSPLAAHLATTLGAGVVPWLGALASGAAGATTRGCLGVALALTWVPELAVGLFGMTPDLPLALTWLAALGLAAFAVRSPADSFRALAASLGVGALVGLATLAKLSGVLLGAGLLAASLTRPLRARYRTVAPWAALSVALVLIAPLAHWEISQGFPMARHRLIATQSAAGFSLKNLGAFLGGQLAYVTPPFLLGAALVLRQLFRARREDAVSTLLFWSTALPALPLALLCLWSRVAEPHWFAPAYLALALQLGRAGAVGPRLARASVLTGIAVVAFAWLWIRTDLAPRSLGAAYRARYDLANDLHAWRTGGALLDASLARVAGETGERPVVIGPHWIVCAQAHAHLGRRASVGCNGPRRDDFDDWLPRPRWAAARHLLFVHDSRFDVDPERELPGRVVRSVERADVVRGGRVVRSIWVTHLERVEYPASSQR